MERRFKSSRHGTHRSVSLLHRRSDTADLFCRRRAITSPHRVITNLHTAVTDVNPQNRKSGSLRFRIFSFCFSSYADAITVFRSIPNSSSEMFFSTRSHLSDSVPDSNSTGYRYQDGKRAFRFSFSGSAADTFFRTFRSRYIFSDRAADGKASFSASIPGSPAEVSTPTKA